MSALREFASEIAGLFVEDRFFALAIAAWLVFAAPLLRVVPVAFGGASLFLGLALILIFSVAKAARGPRS